MAYLDVRSVAKTLGSTTGTSGEDASAVLREVSLQVHSGECVGLSGSTGAGKSTLLRIIAGLEKPDRGEIWLDGKLASSAKEILPPGERKIGFVFQHLGLWPHLTVAGHLDFVLEPLKLMKAEKNLRKEELLTEFSLQSLAKRYPVEISGGEKRLLGLCRALCGDIKLLLLDEPFHGLDGALEARVIDTLARIRRTRKLATLLVSHAPKDFERLCDRVVNLREGHTHESSGRAKSGK
jgi:ABC-type sulfate/molybdate transport systems ATPase subunit